jgi:hypothetical protein
MIIQFDLRSIGNIRFLEFIEGEICTWITIILPGAFQGIDIFRQQLGQLFAFKLKFPLQSFGDIFQLEAKIKMAQRFFQ